MTASFTASEYVALPEALYPAQVVSIEEMPGDQFGDYLRWKFKIRKPDGQVEEVGFNTSNNTGPKSNAYKWATGILGQKPVARQTLDLAGKACQLHIIINEDGFNRIAVVLPPAAQGGTSPASQAPMADDAPPRTAAQMAAAATPPADLPF